MPLTESAINCRGRYNVFDPGALAVVRIKRQAAAVQNLEPLIRIVVARIIA
jgi:hypothetical protein